MPFTISGFVTGACAAQSPADEQGPYSSAAVSRGARGVTIASRPAEEEGRLGARDRRAKGSCVANREKQPGGRSHTVVTGFAGLIASHPTGRLLANWHPVVGIDSFTEVRGLRLSVAGDGVSAPRKRR